MRAVATVRYARPHDEPPHGAPEALEVFSHEILQRRVVQHLLGQQLLQTPVLILQCTQPPRVGHVQPAVFCFPLVERCPADAMAAAQVFGLRPRLVLLQHPNDLLFREPALPHRRSPSIDSTISWKEFWGAGQAEYDPAQTSKI